MYQEYLVMYMGAHLLNYLLKYTLNITFCRGFLPLERHLNLTDGVWHAQEEKEIILLVPWLGRWSMLGWTLRITTKISNSNLIPCILHIYNLFWTDQNLCHNFTAKINWTFKSTITSHGKLRNFNVHTEGLKHATYLWKEPFYNL